MKGVIFIPDISGFTNFVKNIDIQLGVSITHDLLNVIIDNNPIKMEISEIEGDAILFYKLGEPVPFNDILHAFAKIQEAFNQKFKEYKAKYNIDCMLALKLILHYGDIVVYDIKGFKKLYGEAVIESHKLLKNGIGTNDYVLITEDYFAALEMKIADVLMSHVEAASYKSILMSGIQKIACYFFPQAKKHLVFHTSP